jgi:hypothetical protein
VDSSGAHRGLKSAQKMEKTTQQKNKELLIAGFNTLFNKRDFAAAEKLWSPYVKVVQRLPVKILFENDQDSEHLLRPGMSVVPSVKIK